MKKLFIFVLVFIGMTCINAIASDNVHVRALSAFSEENPSERIDVQVLEESSLNGVDLKAGDIIHCEVTKITGPKRGKRSGSFSVIPVSYTSEGINKNFSQEYTGKYSKRVISKKEIKKDIKSGKVVKKTAVTVGNYFVKGLAPAVSVAEGMIKNEDGNRLKSGVHHLYEDSPISYVEKGEPINIKIGDEFYLKFKTTDDDDDADDDEYAESKDTEN